jgi:hypothetical protein
MNAAALEEGWRQLKRWAWRHLNLAHPGWIIATRTEDVSPEEMQRRMAARGD